MRNKCSFLNLVAALAAVAIVPVGLAQCPGPCEGDLTGDGRVDLSDLARLLARYGLCCDQTWEPDEHTVALWYLNGNGLDFSGNGNDLTIKTDRVGWIDDAPHCRGVLMGVDPGDPNGCPDNGALVAPGSACAYPGSGDWTIEAWVYFPSNSRNYAVINHYSEHVSGQDPYCLRVDSGEAKFEINNTLVVSADVSAYRGSWFHLAAVYRYEQDAAIWASGERLAIQPTSEVPEALTGYDVYLGGDYCTTSTGLKIDELRIADRAGSPGWELFVCDYGNDEMRGFDGVTGDLVLPPTSCGDPANPAGMAVGPDGKIYLCSTLDDRILCYDIEANQWTCTVFASGDPLNGPIGLTFGPDPADPNDGDDDLYVVNYLDYHVTRYDWPDGGVEDSSFISGDLPTSPIDLVFGPDGNLYITSSHEDCVKRYNGTTGEYIDDFVAPSSGGLDHPDGLRFGVDGYLYVASGLTSEVLRYDAEGTPDPDNPFASEGLGGPRYLEFGPDGNLYVTNLYGDNVTRYDPTDGHFIDTFASDGLDVPTGLAFRRAD